MSDLLRASDAERHHVVAVLGRHASAGRLTLEEFSERAAAAYGARTVAELAGLTRDLPAEARTWRVPRRRTAAVLALALVSVLVSVGLLFGMVVGFSDAVYGATADMVARMGSGCR